MLGNLTVKALNHPGSNRQGPTIGPSLNYRPFTFPVVITVLWGFLFEYRFLQLQTSLRKMVTDSDSRVPPIWMVYKSYTYSSSLKINSMPWKELPCHLVTMFVDWKYLSGWFTALQSF